MQIMESLKQFGIAAGDTNILIARFDATPDEVCPVLPLKNTYSSLHYDSVDCYIEAGKV